MSTIKNDSWFGVHSCNYESKKKQMRILEELYIERVSEESYKDKRTMFENDDFEL